jgi:hypothetical protein
VARGRIGTCELPEMPDRVHPSSIAIPPDELGDDL